MSSDRSLPAAISNIRTNIPRGPMPELVQNRFPPGVDATTMGRISFCASATFVFTTPPIALTRNERGMRARCAIQADGTGAGLAGFAKFYSSNRRERDSSENNFGSTSTNCNEFSRNFANVIDNIFFLLN